jgi:hypothetical protein
MSNYNPFKSALSAAVSELSSPKAKTYYVHRAQQDVFAVIALVVGMSCFAYEMGSQLRAWTDKLEAGAIAQPEVMEIVVVGKPVFDIVVFGRGENATPLLLPPVKIAGLLAPEKVPFQTAPTKTAKGRKTAAPKAKKAPRARENSKTQKLVACNPHSVWV